MSQATANQTMVILIDTCGKAVRTEIAPHLEPHTVEYDACVEAIVLKAVHTDREKNGPDGPLWSAFCDSIWYRVNG